MAPNPKILLVTNDFPPTIGGIQSYLRDFVACLNPEDVIVFASTQDEAAAAAFDAEQPYRIIRWPRRVMLPTQATARAMKRIIAEHGIETVWFGAAAPLAIMGRAARAAGARRVVATTHGHEVGWSMLPGARQVLRAIGRSADVVTYISEYTLRRIRPALGEGPRFEHLPSGVDTTAFHEASASEKAATRERFGIPAHAPLVVCVSRLVPRKGQDQLLRAWPTVRERFPEARLMIVGTGRYESTLRMLARHAGGGVTLTGKLDFADMAALTAAADIAAMPARTRGGGLDVEGLGIVYLEAQACAVPVIAGDSGGAPETVTPDTGVVVDGHDQFALADALTALLGDPQRRYAMGQAGKSYVAENWTWQIMGARLRRILGLDEAALD